MLIGELIQSRKRPRARLGEKLSSDRKGMDLEGQSRYERETRFPAQFPPTCSQFGSPIAWPPRRKARQSVWLALYPRLGSSFA
jgi:hypothetical protein